jgi:phage baseplate assembly protein gpV
VLTAILEHNVQLQGDPIEVSATVVAFDSPLYTLVPGITVFPGTPTVKVTGSLTVVGTPGANVLFELVRDRGLAGETVLTHQEVTIGGTTGDLASATLVSLDVDLVEGSVHTWSIRATEAGGIAAEEATPALILVEQKPSGTSVVVPSPPTQAVELNTAADFAAFGGTGITTTGGSSIDGDIGVSPAVTSTAITGFALVLDGSGQFSTSSQVHPSVPTGQLGHVFAFDYAAPTPAKVNQANLDMITAYNDAAGRPADTTAAGGDISADSPLAAGAVYRYTGASSVTAGTLTLNGGPTDVIIIQVAGALDIHQDILLTGGLLPENVFFVAAGQVTIFGGLTVNGEFLGQTGIAMQAGTTLNGRALAQTAVTLINNTIVEA